MRILGQSMVPLGFPGLAGVVVSQSQATSGKDVPSWADTAEPVPARRGDSSLCPGCALAALEALQTPAVELQQLVLHRGRYSLAVQPCVSPLTITPHLCNVESHQGRACLALNTGAASFVHIQPAWQWFEMPACSKL